jgi:formylmethanofuran dehydrogenase subunit B
MSKISDSINYKNIVCPFCSIHCDDIEIDINDNKIHVKSDISPSCKEKFERNNSRYINQISPTVNGRTTNFSEALKKAKKFVKESNESIILNASGDVNVAREMLTASSKINGIYDHVNSNTFLKNLSIYQRKGFMCTSLSEIKNKSDVVVLFSNSILKKYPRLTTRILAPVNSFSTSQKKKQIYIIGNKKNNVKDLSIKDNRITYIDFNNKDIPTLLDSLSKKVNETQLSNRLFNNLVKSIDSSKYLSMIWATSEFMKLNACDKIINHISDYVLSINETSRAACLTLAGNEGDVSSIQTSGWLTGFPSRIKFTGSYFEYDRDLYNTESLIESNNIDLAIYINAFSNKELSLNKKNKNIVIGHPSTKFNIQPHVFLPCGIPGIDYKGLIFRTDNVVSLPLSSIKIPTYRSVQEILRGITSL